jgi:hypothetical protein
MLSSEEIEFLKNQAQEEIGFLERCTWFVQCAEEVNENTELYDAAICATEARLQEISNTMGAHKRERLNEIRCNITAV